MRGALLVALCASLAGCSLPEPAGGAGACRPLALDLLTAGSAAVGERIEMDVVLSNCTDEPQLHTLDCMPPTPVVEVDGRAYHVRYGAATDALPACITSSYSAPTTLVPRGKVSWRYNWNGTVASGCFGGDGCGPEVPAPGRHVLRVEHANETVERSVEFR